MAGDLDKALKDWFGYDSFRPLQREIISDVLAGKDVFALLPTGGGKSLCYQLPAVMREGLTLVVSPLIALMKDQVDALETAGVAATFLNSSLSAGEARARWRRIHEGDIRLLYVAPERLMTPHFLEQLPKWNVQLVAVDEAHCISEWGHDFRPEYRKLSELRAVCGDASILALTATATSRVREDILRQLRLQEAGSYVASFNRPNLMYRVLAREKPYAQLAGFIKARPRESGIVYCQSRKTSERLAEKLAADGFRAKPYHAGLTAQERSAHQEQFVRDEVKVICATIAFGMGIDKPNVRYVVHYDLPKNVEGYYQETGRAGRDGLPSECLLLFSAADVVKQKRFIEEKEDPEERAVARAQLQQMVHYAESARCRRVELLGYFGEEWTDGKCDGCDNCLSPRETFDGTVAAQKLLSCVYRVRQKNGFSFGLNHVVEVLLGADTENIRKWRHSELSVYGVGAEMAKNQWQSVGRELMRLGYLRQTADKFPVVELTPSGLKTLRERKPVMLSKLAAPAKARQRRSGEIECDEVLFDRLRDLRRRLADEREVPAYVIFSDVTLREMARDYPRDETAMGSISGVGSRKLADFGEVFLREIDDYLDEKSNV